MSLKIKPFQLDIDEDLILQSDPISPKAAVNKQYVDDIKIKILSQTINYTAYSNGIISYYINIPMLKPNQSITITLPISNNSGELFLKDYNESIGPKISNITKTNISFTNHTRSTSLPINRYNIIVI